MKHRKYVIGLVILLSFSVTYNVCTMIKHLGSVMNKWDAIGIPLAAVYFTGYLTFYCTELLRKK